ncbi:MAG: hypothetical protein J6V93_03240 [Clostridia bacterium]|nr:hypothetical protein [Clostridia bacterium]
MILQASTLADKNNNGKFFFGTLKSVWTQGVISFSVMFFLAPVLLMIVADSYSATVFRPTPNIQGLVDTIYESYSFYCFFAAVLAVLFATATFNYLNSRVSVNFYHSLPFKRTRLFFVHYISGIFSFVIGFFLNYLICILIPAITDMGFFECLPALSSVFFNVLIYFVLIYSITVLVGMTTGLAPVQWLMTALVLAILPAIKICINGLRGFNSNRFWIDYFFEYDKFLPTSPVVVLFDNAAFSLTTKLVFAAITVFCVILSVILYHYRLSEKSGNPFVFNKFASFVKYLVMVPGSMSFALIFGYLGDRNFLWLVFGSVSGAIVAWMIMNSIISKTARAMFNAARGMVIFVVCVSAVNLFFVYGTTPIENAILTDGYISSVTIELDGSGEFSRVTFDEKENKEALLDIVRMEIDKADEYGYISEYSSGVSVTVTPYDSKYIDEDRNVMIDGKKYYVGLQSADHIRVRVVAKTSLGYEIARSFSVSDRVGDYFEELKIIADSDEYKEEMKKLLDTYRKYARISVELRPNMIKDGVIGVTVGDEKLVHFNDYSQLRYNPDIHDDLFAAYEKDLESISFDSYNAPVIGQIYVRDTGYSSNLSLPVTTKFYNTLEYFKECGIINSVDYAHDLAGAIKTVYIFDYQTGKVLTVKDDEAKLCEIFESIDTYDIYSQYSSFFNTVDHRYRVLYDYTYHEFNTKNEYTYDEYGNSIGTPERVTYSSEGGGTARAEFIYGKVPAFVSEYFN